MQVPIPTSRNRQADEGDHPSSPEVTIQVSSFVSNARNSVKSHHTDRFMQHSRTAIRQERNELVGVEPRTLTRFPEFEGTIYGIQVEFNAVQYAENVINATMNASPNRDPDINYLLSIGLQFSNRFL